MTDKNLHKAESPLSIREMSERAAARLCNMIESPVYVLKKLNSAEKIIDTSFVEKLKGVFSISSEYVFIVSYPSGEIIYSNPAAEERVKSVGFEISKKRISDYFKLEGPEGSVLSADKTRLNVFLTNNDVCEQVELTATDISGGDFSLLLVYAKNISAIKKSRRMLYESELQHRSTLNAIPDGVVVVNKNLEVVIYNKAFESIVSGQTSCDSLAGRRLGDVAPFIPGKLGLEYRYVFTSGKSLDTTIKHRQDGKITYYEVIKTPIFDNGEVIQAVTILRDRTKNFQLEEIKKEAFFQIEKNMEQFAILNDHVRNPLQAIVGLADLYGDEVGEKIISQAREINDIVIKLDAGWIESDKVRDMLSKHYGITVKRRPNVDSPIGMLKTDEIF